MANDTKPRKKITIVGGGQACRYAIEELVTLSTVFSDFDVDIIHADKEDQFGYGLAWSPQQTTFNHRTNNYFSENPAPNTTVSSEFTETQRARGEAPRSLKGAGYREDLGDALKALRAQGVTIDIKHETSVDAVKKVEPGYDLLTNRGEKIHSDFMILGTGHWQSKNKLSQNPGVYESPWPAKKFDDVNYDQRIAIMGSGLSAVDAITTLAHNAGTFTSDINLPNGSGVILRDDGEKKFSPRKGDKENKNFKIDVYSRHGVLPSVLGLIETGAMIFNEEQLKSLQNPQGRIALDDVYTILKKRFIQIHEKNTDPALQKVVETLQKTKTFDDAFNVFIREFGQKDHQSRLQDELKDALQSLKEKKPLPLQIGALSVSVAIEQCYRYFSAEDQQRYMNQVHPYISHYGVGMMVSNAQDISALMKDGRLKVHELGLDSSIGTKTVGETKLEGAEIRPMKSAPEHYNVVVKATGDNLRELKTSSLLMENLFEQGIANDVVFPYSSREAGEAAKKTQDENPAAPTATFEKGGKYYYSIGGLRLTPNNELTSDQFPQASNIFSLGPPAIGYTPLIHGAGPMKVATNRIIKTILSRIGEKQAILPAGSFKDEESGVIFINTNVDNKVMAFMPGSKPLTIEQQRSVLDRVHDALGTDKQIGFMTSASLPPKAYNFLQVAIEAEKGGRK